MAEVSRATVLAFYRAYAARDADRMAAFLHEEIEWLISGPVALLPYCGVHRGKAEVVDLFRRKIPAVFAFRGFDPEMLLIDGDCAAMFGRLSGLQRSTGRMISYRHAQFLRFCDDRLISVRAMLDGLDIAEQWLGRPLDLTGAGEAPLVPDGNLVGV